MHAEASHARIGRRDQGIGTGLHAQAEMGERFADLRAEVCTPVMFLGACLQSGKDLLESF